jgi:hypothetical protein
MSVTRDIVASWRRPRAVMRAHLARPQSEPFAFSLLVTFLILAFVAQWPRASRVAFENPEIPIAPQMLGIAFGLLAFGIPLAYAVAAASGGLLRLMTGRPLWYAARLALFWALVAVTPLMLLQGLVSGMIGPGPALTSVSVLAGLAFLTFWVVNLIEAGR